MRTRVRKTPAPLLSATLDRYLAHAPWVVCLCAESPPYTPFYVSPNLERVLGISPDSLLASPDAWLEHVHGDDRPGLLDALSRSGQNSAQSLEFRLQLRPGKISWVREEMTLMEAGDGLPTHLQRHWHDITSCKQAEEENTLLRQILDNLPQHLFWKDRNGIFLGCNQSAAHELGLISPAAIVGKSDHDLFPGGKGDYFARMDLEVISQGTAQQHVLSQRQHESGESDWLDTSKVPLRDENGVVTGLLISYEDMTHHTQVEESLRKFKQAVEQSRSAIVFTDTSGVIEYVNPRFCAVYGYQASEVIGQHTRLLQSGLTPPETYPALWLTLAAGLGWHGEFCNRRKDGTTTWQSASISPIFDQSGSVTHFVSIEDGIDELKHFQGCLHDQLLFMQELIDTIPNPLFYADSSAHYLGCNQAFERFFGVERGQIIGKTALAMGPPELAQIYHGKNLELLENPGQQVYQTIALRSDGRRRDIITHKATFLRADGCVGGLVGLVLDITEIKQLEHSLREEQEKFRHLVEDANVIAYEADPHTLRLSYISPRAEAVFGYPLADWLLPGFWLDHVHPDDCEQLLSHIPAISTQDGHFHRIEYRVLEPDGGTVWIEDVVRVFADDSGRPQILRGIMIDITRRKLDEITLRASEERFRTIADYTYTWENWVSPAGQLLWVNPSVKQITGYTPEECYAMQDFPMRFIHPEDRAAVAYDFRHAMEGILHHTVDLRFRLLHKDGSVRTCSVTWQSVFDQNGHHLGHRSSIRDITPQVEAEMDRKRAEQMLRLVLDHLPQRVFWKDRDSRYLDGNRAFLADLGLSSRAGLIGKDDFAFSPPQLARKYIRDDQKVMSSNRPRLNFEETSELEQSGMRWIETSKLPMHGPKGEVIGVLGMYQDISEQKVTEQKLQKTLREMKTILDNAQVGIAFMVDRKFVWVNHRLEEMFGYKNNELRGKPSRLLYPSQEDFEQFGREAYPQMAEGKSYETERIMRRRNSRLFWCHLRGSAVDSRHVNKGSIWIMLDIDKRKTAENRLLELNQTLELRVTQEVDRNMEQERLLVKQSRMAAMGEMIGNIAHQWRQPLSVLALIVQNMQADFQEAILDGEKMDEYAHKAMNSIRQMSGTIDDFRNFFRPNRNKDLFDVMEAVQDTLNLLDASFRHNNIRVEINGPAQLEIWGYKNDFAQILLNLLSNAKDVLVERKVPDGRVAISVSANQDLVSLVVSDNGGGVSADIVENMFEPYFTTKPSGTGIGLYMAKTIVEQHMRGQLFFRNALAGAEFTVIIPREIPN